MGDLDARALPSSPPDRDMRAIGDIPSHAQLNDVGVKGALAVHWVTDYRLGHSAPRAVNSAVYPMPRDAPEPAFAARRVCADLNGNANIRHVFSQQRKCAVGSPKTLARRSSATRT